MFLPLFLWLAASVSNIYCFESDLEDDLSFGDEFGKDQPEWVLPAVREISTIASLPDQPFREDFEQRSAYERPDWLYNPKEWHLYEVPNIGQFDIPQENSPTIFLLAEPLNPKEKIKVTVPVKGTSKQTLEYKFLLKQGDATTMPPTLRIFQYSFGSKTGEQIHEEKVGSDWIKETQKIIPEEDTDQIVFVVEKNDKQNEVGLGDVILKVAENGENNVEPTKPLPLDKTTSSPEKQNSVTSSYSAINTNEQIQPGVLNVHEILTTTEDNGDKMENNNISYENDTSTIPAPEQTDSPGEVYFMNPNEGSLIEENSKLNNVTDGSNTSHSSSGKTLRTFLILLTLTGIAAFIFVVWRRRRRRSKDDEIPVFSRSSAEHSNPSYNADADIGDGINNYRSFQ